MNGTYKCTPRNNRGPLKKETVTFKGRNSVLDYLNSLHGDVTSVRAEDEKGLGTWLVLFRGSWGHFDIV